MKKITILMVCTGNTCRSPMAAAIAREILDTQRQDDNSNISLANLDVISAGIFASNGLPAADEAIAVMKDEGVDLSSHRSTALSKELINSVDIIYSMTENHRRSILQIEPKAQDKTFNLNPNADIADPVGTDKKTYHKTAKTLRKLLQSRLNELQNESIK